MRLLTIALVSLLFFAPGTVPPAKADGFEQIQSKSTFVSLMNGRELTRFGINLVVTPDGRIDGRAFGRDVRGAWRWQGGYFCRDLFWGQRNLGPNCQMVKLQGRTIRFISDKGAGEFADLQLKGG
ncbi:MAG: dihydrodipicolinate reductase [Pseudomonadota bacterium]